MAILIGITHRNTMRQPDCWLLCSCSHWWGSYGVKIDVRCIEHEWNLHLPAYEGSLLVIWLSRVKFKQQRGYQLQNNSRYGQNAVSSQYLIFLPRNWTVLRGQYEDGYPRFLGKKSGWLQCYQCFSTSFHGPSTWLTWLRRWQACAWVC
jgi:hypothetical protein